MAGVVRVSTTESDIQSDGILTRDGLERTLMISMDEHQRLIASDRQVHAAGDLPDALLDAVRRSEMDPRHEHLDALLEDWSP